MSKNMGKFQMDHGFDALTGKRRNRGTDTEHERQAVGPGNATGGMGLNCTATGHQELDQFHGQMNDLLLDDVMQMAVRDKLKGEADAALKAARGGEAEETGDTGACADHEDNYDGKNVEDDDLEMIRQRRLEKMREAHRKKEEYKLLGHGEYTEIKEDEFLPTVTKSYRSVVHFYHKNFESCKVMDMHLQKMAKKFMGTKFVKLEAEKAPFFVSKLAVQTIPSLCMFIDGVLVGKQLGFSGIEGGQKNEVKTGHLARQFRTFDVLEEEFDSEDDV